MKIVTFLCAAFLTAACSADSSEQQSVVGKWHDGRASIEIDQLYVTVTDNGQGFKYLTGSVAPLLTFASQNGQFNFRCDYALSGQTMSTYNCSLNGKAKEYYGPISAEAQTLRAMEREWNKYN